MILTQITTHVFKLDRDFSIVKNDRAAAESVAEVLRKLRTFRVAVHPRVRLLYGLLRRGLSRHAQRSSDSLYAPHAYRSISKTPADQTQSSLESLKMHRSSNTSTQNDLP
ncbi:uncharacterized protein [Battus philenor]|uniref:uncharacterized protein n=1 Tax=Battus philenor TaxID=42288 RepID=UPI0035D0A95A